MFLLVCCWWWLLRWGCEFVVLAWGLGVLLGVCFVGLWLLLIVGLLFGWFVVCFGYGFVVVGLLCCWCFV